MYTCMASCAHVVTLLSNHVQDMAGQDAMFAQLLGMGFDPEAIEGCQVAMATSSQKFSVQAATEW